MQALAATIRSPANTLGLSADEAKVFAYLTQNGESARKAVELAMSWSMSKTTSLLNQLADRGLVERIGSSRNIRYRVKG